MKELMLLMAFLLLASITLAQTGDWHAVKHLPGGTMLKIKLKRGHTFGHCEFMGATDDALHCDYPGLQYIRAQFPRENVKAVYLVHNARAIGAGIGAGAGAVIGAAATPGPIAGRELCGYRCCHSWRLRLFLRHGGGPVLSWQGRLPQPQCAEGCQ